MIITCENGHTFQKSSNCRVCPICSAKEYREHEFLKHFAAPARRALFRAGITSFEKLQESSTEEIQSLHGIGPSTVKKIKELLNH